MKSTSPSCCLFFFILYVFLDISQGASVQYVPNAMCATPSGCDFNSPIWNITGVPSAGDDVYIQSDVQITIFANNTSISLNSMWFGGNGTSADITIVLKNCILEITEDSNTSGLYWKNSTLELYYSTVSCQHVHGATLLATNVTLNVVELIIEEAMMTSCTSGTYADYWTFSNATLLSSTLSTSFLDFGNLLSEGSLFNVSNRTAFFGNAQIRNGFLAGNQTFFVSPNSSVVLIDTITNMVTLTLEGPSSTFSFLAPNSQQNFTFATQHQQVCPPDSFIYLGDGVTATIVSEQICHLIVAEQVTLNLDAHDFMKVTSIKMLGTTPTTINIMTCILTFNNPFYLFANVNVSQHGMIYVSSNLTVNGTINGNGTVILYGGHLICDNLLIAKVEYSNSVVITAQSRFSTSLIKTGMNLFPNATKFVVNAPETHVWSPRPSNSNGISIYPNNHIFFNGNYNQTGGIVDIHTVGPLATPIVLVNGSVSLTKVTVTGNMRYNVTKILLFRSLTKSILKNEQVSFENTEASGSKYRLVAADGDIYIELITNPPRHQDNFFERNYLISIGGATVILLIVAVLIVLLWRHRHRSRYVSLNN